MRNTRQKLLTAFAVLILSLFAGGIARAQEDSGPPVDDPSLQEQQPADDTPVDNTADNAAHGMARVSMVHGDVSTQRADSGDWSAATLNTPLSDGDKISTGQKSRAEVQLDFADVLRLADNSQASIAALERTRIQIQLGEGLAYFSMLKGHEADVEIDTPNVSVHPIGKDGAYRIYVNPGGQTEIIVRNGEAEISTPQGSTRVKKGDLITVQGTVNDAQFKITGAPGKDDWDAFNQDRDRIIQGADAWHHTNHYYTGSEDLDAYGTWSEVPDVGRVWIPQQGPDWAPYRDGNWVWEPYWGWTWVGGEPWGWAPYHYGRWFVTGGRWGWWPGPVAVGYYPVWSPAYVSFFGYGPGFGVGFGWFPCGPADFFYPWWGGFGFGFGFVDVVRFHDRGFGRGFDRGFGRGFRPLLRNDRFSNLHNFERNARVRGGFSGLAGDHFGRGGARPGAVNPGAFRNGRLMTGNLPVVPSRESLSASGKFQSPGTGAARGVGNQSFFAKHMPAAKPQPFSQQATHLQNSIQKDGHFTPVTAGGRGSVAAGGAASPTSGARVIGNGKVEGNNRGAGAEGKFGGAASPSSGARVVGNGSVERNTAPGASTNRGATTERPSLNSGARQTAPGFSNPGSGVARPNGESNVRPGGPTTNPGANSGSGNSGTSNNGGWQKFSTQPNSGAGRPATSPSGTARPPLNMNKPIVTQRPNGGFGGSSTRPSASPSPSYRPPTSTPPAGNSRPTYNAPSYPSGGGRPAYSAPSRPTYSAPSRPAYSAPSRPSYSAPRQSAPAPRQSAPSFHPPSGGGSRAPSGGGSHAPSGGSRSSGGSSRSSGGGGGGSHHH